MNITAYTIFGTPIGGQGGGTSPPSPTPEPELWTRPADWLELPVVVNGDSRYVGLYHLIPETKWVALSATGNYTVDWGDGIIENFASGVTAFHTYDYATFDPLRLTQTSEGYLQAIISVTPQAGHTLTGLNLNKTDGSGESPSKSGLADIVIAGPDLTSLLIGSSALSSDSTNVAFNRLKQVSILENKVTTFNFVLAHLTYLESIPVLYTSYSTDFVAMLAYATNLKYVCDFDTSLGTAMGSIFYKNNSLISAPNMDLSKTLGTINLFYECYSLENVPEYNLQLCTNISNMFLRCYKVKGISLINTGAVTTAPNFAEDCYALESLSMSNCSALITYFFCMKNCFSLTSLLLIGLTRSFEIPNGNLDGPSLNALYTSIGSATGGSQSITITGNKGVSSDDPSIATAKGWTISG